jgi:protein-S-isoprenylcysteine O-methyltransferase Ste14
MLVEIQQVTLVVPALIWLVFDEESILKAVLVGYTEYCAKVRWRLIPGMF